MVILSLAFGGGYLISRNTVPSPLSYGLGHANFWENTGSPAWISDERLDNSQEFAGKLPKDLNLREVWRLMDPARGGDPSLSVDAVFKGILLRVDMSSDLARDILDLALSENPDGVTAYLLGFLEDGKLGVLRETLPLPAFNQPALPRLLAGYAKAFGAGWLDGSSRIPFALRRIGSLPSPVLDKCVSALVESGPDSLRLAATAYPARIAENTETAAMALNLLEDSRARLALLKEMLTASGPEPILPENIRRTSGEKLLVELLLAQPSPGNGPNQSTPDPADVKLVLDLMQPSEALYNRAVSLSDDTVSGAFKIEIIRRMAGQNLVAATRALSNDPNPPDEAIAIAVEAMSDDVEAAQAWIARIRSPEIRSRFH